MARLNSCVQSPSRTYLTNLLMCCGDKKKHACHRACSVHKSAENMRAVRCLSTLSFFSLSLLRAPSGLTSVDRRNCQLSGRTVAKGYKSPVTEKKEVTSVDFPRTRTLTTKVQNCATREQTRGIRRTFRYLPQEKQTRKRFQTPLHRATCHCGTHREEMSPLLRPFSSWDFESQCPWPSYRPSAPILPLELEFHPCPSQ